MNPKAPWTQPSSQVFRERMREARQASDISQQGLVRRLKELGVSMNQPAVARIEAGERKVSLDEAVAIARVLRVPLERLYASWEDYLVIQAERSPEEAWTNEQVRRQEQGNDQPSKEDQ
jgi:transcriptional regulator with XRE-family HTH domain